MSSAASVRDLSLFKTPTLFLKDVLNNARRHAAQRGLRLPRTFVDPCSSAAHFDGWKSPPNVPEHDPPSVAAPRTWLLSTGWFVAY
ncbi:MAG: hypothetical protein AAFU77_06590 [Myxococcota bacterium]